MAITNKEEGVWSIDQVYAKQNQGSIWDYDTNERSAFVWGRNTMGELGQNNLTNRSSPVQVPGTNWSTLKDGSNCTHGVKSDGTLWAWGRNDQGRLGVNQPTSSKYSSPVQIPGTTWSTNRNHLDNRSISSGAIKTDGTLWMWGEGGSGRLGQNANSSYSSPRQIPGTTWNAISTSYNGQFGIKTDGTLWSWGANNNGTSAGVLGHNNRTNYSSPKQIPGTTWSRVVVSSNSSSVVATKTDGTMWTWGSNAYGALAQQGISHNIKYSSPVQIPGTTWTDEFAVGAVSPLGVKSDGTLWSWGKNDNSGQLGQNNRTNQSSPVQIPGTTWSKVGSKGYVAFGIKTDGTAWSWGDNEDGRLGQNQPESSLRSSPVQLPGTDWDRIEGAHQHAVGLKIL